MSFKKTFVNLGILSLALTSFITITPTQTLASVNTNPRIYGLDRYQTSTALASQIASQTLDNVVLASGNGFADALSASTLAYELNAPILLVNKSTQNSNDALGYIQDHLQAQGTIYIIGGSGIIGSDFDSYLSGQGYQVKRLGGYTRYDTNMLVDNQLTADMDGTAFIATGVNFPDALSISSFASETNAPIILVKKNEIPQSTQDYLKDKQPKTIYIAGGVGVISSDVEDQIQTMLPDATITRFAGYSRYDTAAAAYNQFAMNPKNIYLASGESYPDALSGSVLAAQNGDPILLIDPNTPFIPDSIAAYLSQLYQNGISPNVAAIGGKVVVPDSVINNVVNLLSGEEQSPRFEINKVDPRLILGGPVSPLPSQDYWFNKNTYKYYFSYSDFHSSVQRNLYYYMLNRDNEASVHNKAVTLHGGITINNCVFFQAEALRRVGFNINYSMANTVQFSDLLPRLGFKKDTNIKNLKPGDIVITKGYTHTYTFMGWVNPGELDYAYVVDNQAGSFNGQVYHVRRIGADPVAGTDPMAFFFYH